MSMQSVRAYRALTLITCLLCVIATLLHIIAYSTPNWIVSDGNSPFVKIGWHQACFDHCHHPYCPGGDPEIVFDGCYMWAFNDQLRNDYNFQELVHWLFPSETYILFCCSLALHIDPEAKARASGSEREMQRARASENFSRSEREK